MAGWTLTLPCSSTTRTPWGSWTLRSRWAVSATVFRSAQCCASIPRFLAAMPPEADQVGELRAAHGSHPIWRIRRNGHDVAVLHPGVGASLAAGFLEEAIVLGARKVVACGGCGVLSPDVQAGQVIVPTEAVRDEGTSFHYLPASRTVAADPEVWPPLNFSLWSGRSRSMQARYGRPMPCTERRDRKWTAAEQRGAWPWKWKRPPSLLSLDSVPSASLSCCMAATI